MPPPSLETPPNPVEPPQNKVTTGRYGEIDTHELIHLMDQLEDERAKARFRESIYISLFIWLIIGWFLFYGPRIFPHPPQIVRQEVPREHGLTELALPPSLQRAFPRTPQPPAVKTPPPVAKATPQPPRPTPPPAARVQPTPAQPKAAPPPPVQHTQPSPLPTPPPKPQQRPQLATIPDSPKPSALPEAPNRPNFGNSGQSAGDAIRNAARNAAQPSGAMGGITSGITPQHVGVGTGVDILSDTMGVDFNPYLKRILHEIYTQWIPLIPEEARPPLNKSGVTQIRFKILPNGQIGGMWLEDSTHDDALNRAAWGSITGVGVFPSLPSQFHGPNLELRIRYLVNTKPPDQ